MEKPAVTIILTSWGTGSTAVTGYLDKCGGYTCPPHLRTVDSRTPNSYEPMEYRNALAACVDELTLERRKDPQVFQEFVSQWLPRQWDLAKAAGKTRVVLKHPLQAFFIPVLDKVADCRFVVVKRLPQDIERTRERRKWPPTFGASGAEAIYEIIRLQMEFINKPYLEIPFEHFGKDAALRDTLIAFSGLKPTTVQKMEAEAFLR